MANVTLKEFSGIISTLEILMIKKYCLRNYLDSYKEVINDFVVNFDPEKTKDPMKQRKTLKMTKKQLQDSEFIGKLKAFRDLEFINIKNPEYVLSIVAEEQYTNLMQREKPNPIDVEGLKSIL